MAVNSPDMVHPKNVHNFTQEMVCSIYGLPAAVVQYGIGLEQTTENATLLQYQKQAWETGMMPVGDQFAAQMGWQLFPAFGMDPKIHRLDFDYSGVEALQEKEDDKSERILKQFTAGLITRAMALEALGWPVLPSDHVRHLGISVIEVPDGMSQLDLEAQQRAALPEPVVTVEDERRTTTRTTTKLQRPCPHGSASHCYAGSTRTRDPWSSSSARSC